MKQILFVLVAAIIILDAGIVSKEMKRTTIDPGDIKAFNFAARPIPVPTPREKVNWKPE